MFLEKQLVEYGKEDFEGLTLHTFCLLADAAIKEPDLFLKSTILKIWPDILHSLCMSKFTVTDEIISIIKSQATYYNVEFEGNDLKDVATTLNTIIFTVLDLLDEETTLALVDVELLKSFVASFHAMLPCFEPEEMIIVIQKKLSIFTVAINDLSVALSLSGITNYEPSFILDMYHNILRYLYQLMPYEINNLINVFRKMYDSDKDDFIITVKEVLNVVHTIVSIIVSQHQHINFIGWQFNLLNALILKTQIFRVTFVDAAINLASIINPEEEEKTPKFLN